MILAFGSLNAQDYAKALKTQAVYNHYYANLFWLIQPIQGLMVRPTCF